MVLMGWWLEGHNKCVFKEREAEYDVLSTVPRGKDNIETNKSQGTSSIIEETIY